MKRVLHTVRRGMFNQIEVDVVSHSFISFGVCYRLDFRLCTIMQTHMPGGSLFIVFFFSLLLFLVSSTLLFSYIVYSAHRATARNVMLTGAQIQARRSILIYREEHHVRNGRECAIRCMRFTNVTQNQFVLLFCCIFF